MLKNLFGKENNLEKQVESPKAETGLLDFLHNFIKELGDYLNNMNNQKENILVVDRIENGVAVCEDRNTGKMVEIPKEELPQSIHDGTVLIERNGKYEISKEKQDEIENRINEKAKNVFRNLS